MLWLLPLLAGMVVLLPVVLLAGAGNPPCTPTAGGPPAVTPVGAPSGGQFAAPLVMKADRWYRVGATEYGGGIGSSGLYLPDYPNTFAELSLLDANPYPDFTFADADALNNLPYGTAIRVANGERQMVLIKRDIGYGQGPGQTLPYRIDVYDSSAPALGVTKNPVEIELAPSSGTGATLGQLPPTTSGPADTGGCPTGASGPLPLTPGQTARILPSGLAAAPQDAPQAVKEAIAAGNQIDDKPYSVPPGSPAAHYGPLATLWPAYDCSGAVSYLLYKIGQLHTAEVSSALESWGQPGPGKWITVYASGPHTWITVAGIAFDTSATGQTVAGIPAGSGPALAPQPHREPRRRLQLRPTPPRRPMTRRRPHLVSALLAAVALAGCGITDPYTHPATQQHYDVGRAHTTRPPARSLIPANRRPPSGPPRPRSGVTAGTSSAGAATPRQALRLYTRLYVNWTATTIGAHQRQLAAISQGTARAAALQAAASYGRDTELKNSHVVNTGAIVSIAAGQGPERGRWVIVTSEHTTGSGDYTGLPAAAHVTYAHVTHTPHGWVIDQWSPQN